MHVGEYSRGGQSRGVKAVQALDHDMCAKEKLIPGGILEPVSGKSFLFFGTSYKTSDFLVDGLVAWWNERKNSFSKLKELVINADNGPECSGRRTQFLKRMVEFSDLTQLRIRIVYYPPYHSKYNAIERYWAGLEKSWNGYLLDTIATTLCRAKNFFWKGIRTMACLLDDVYEKGIAVCGDEKNRLEQRLQRNPTLPLWDVTIHPKVV